MAANDAYTSALTAADFDEWARLFQGFITHCQYSLPEQQYRKTFERLLDPSQIIYCLVLRDSLNNGKLLAIAHYLPHAAATTEKSAMLLNDLYVDPAARRKGYGRQMLQAVIDEAKKHNCFTLHWAAYHSNMEARNLYDQMASCHFVEYRVQTGERW